MHQVAFGGVVNCGDFAMTDPILANLNPQQLEAVTAPDGPMLIVAGAGSGKTRVITRRIAYLVRNRGVHPATVFAATFTNKAAEEMKSRVASMLGEHAPSTFNISTFHSMCARILRRDHEAAGLRSNFTICDDRDQKSAVRHVMKTLGIDDKSLKPADAMSKINQCKIRMLGPEDLETIVSQDAELYTDIFKGYRDYLKANSALDFEDLILCTVDMLMKNPEVLARYQDRFRHVLVDEYQDINLAQFELVRLLAGGHQNLVVVGDEDQSIYSWRGADISYVQDFEQTFAGARIVRLEQNYRSTGNILHAASAVIANNSRRHEKTLFTDGADGPPIYLVGLRSDREESTMVANMMADLVRESDYQWGDMAVFYRVGALSRGFEDALRERNIPYRVVGGIRFYDRAEVKDLLAYLQVVDNPHNSIALQRIINTPRRGIGAKTLQTILDRARTDKISDFEALRKLTDEGAFPRGTTGKLMEFVTCIDGWRSYARTHRPGDVLQLVLEETKYIASLGDPENLEVRSRTENLEELVNAVAQFEERHENATLQDYLENVTLVAVPADEPGEDESAASLLTLHSAKGLEFRVVFMVGLDDNIIPSPRAMREASGSLQGSGGVEEERRLFYVGITRAREVLFMTRCQSRMLYGEVLYPSPSMFLGELPHDCVEFVSDVYDFDFDELGRLLRTTGRVERPALPPRREAPGRPTLDLPQPVARPPARPGTLQPGSRVRHPVLGDAVITGVSGRGPSAKLVVQLEDGTCYTFLAQHANLQLVDD